MKLKKGFFYRSAVSDLMHTVRRETPKIALKRTSAVRSFKPATNLIELCFFLFLFNVYPRVVSGFSGTIAPLSGHLKYSEPNVFDQEKTELAVLTSHRKNVRHPDFRPSQVEKGHL